MSEPRLSAEDEAAIRHQHLACTLACDERALLAEIDRLRALVQKYETRLEINHCFELRPDRQFSGDVDHDLIRRDLSETEKERFPDAVECRDATIALLESNLAERDKMLDVAAKGMEALRAALSDRDRQLAELREACQPLADAWRSFAKHAPTGAKDACGLSVPADPLRRLAALLPPTPKEEPRGSQE